MDFNFRAVYFCFKHNEQKNKTMKKQKSVITNKAKSEPEFVPKGSPVIIC